MRKRELLSDEEVRGEAVHADLSHIKDEWVGEEKVYMVIENSGGIEEVFGASTDREKLLNHVKEKLGNEIFEDLNQDDFYEEESMGYQVTLHEKR